MKITGWSKRWHEYYRAIKKLVCILEGDKKGTRCEPVLRPINSYPHSLFTYDETSPTVVQHKVGKVVSLKSKQRVSFSSAERGSSVTIVTWMNATVTFVPPVLVLAVSKMNAGSCVAFHQFQ
jgi:hypothetical protein